jgi:CHASE1-domain containing sensor protein
MRKKGELYTKHKKPIVVFVVLLFFKQFIAYLIYLSKREKEFFHIEQMLD